MTESGVVTAKWWSKQACDEKGVCYHSVNQDGNILDVNQAWLNYLGLFREDVIGQHCGQFVTSDSLLSLQKNLSLLIKSVQVNSISLRFKTPSQRGGEVLLSSRSEHDAAGNFIRTHCWFAPLDFFLENNSQWGHFLDDIETLHYELRKERNCLNSVLNSVSSFILILQDQQIIRANQPLLDFLQCKSVTELSDQLPLLFKESLLSKVKACCQKSLLTVQPCFELLNPKTQIMHYFDCEVNQIALSDNERVVVLNDITLATTIRLELDYEKSLSQRYLNVVPIIIVALDVNANVTLVNHAGCAMLGYSQDELIGQNWFEMVIEAESVPTLKHVFLQIVLGHQPYPESYENEVICKDGSKRLLSWRNALLTDDSGHVVGTLSSAEDVTELRVVQKNNAFLAHHDALTGLDNRKSLEIHLEQAIKKSHRKHEKFAVCFIDLDNFKIINDSYGHKAGDGLLLSVTDRIKKTIRESDTLARFGGDEFVILLDEIGSEEDVVNTAQKLVDLFKTPMEFCGYSAMSSMSMGVSVYPDDGADSGQLLQLADVAMYDAKNRGKNQFSLYNQEMTVKAVRRASLQEELTAAVTEKQFLVHYQPQLAQQNQTVLGIEALVRWQHPEKGLIAPDNFICLSEEVGLIVPIGEFVLRQACQDIQILHAEEGFQGYVSVNISGVQIENNQFLSMVENVLFETKVDPNLIEMEITESVVMSNPEQWIELFKRLKLLGVKLAIDDFGTGYSSLSQLSQLPLDKLKIDKSFVKDLGHDHKARAVAEAIINLSKSMNMVSLAEGVETQAQNDFLTEKNCSIGQGFLFAKPMPLEVLKEWLAYKNK